MLPSSYPADAQFKFHRKPSGWSGAPCPICGCTAKRLRAEHRAVRAEEAMRWGAGAPRYLKRVSVCFGTMTDVVDVREED